MAEQHVLLARASAFAHRNTMSRAEDITILSDQFESQSLACTATGGNSREDALQGENGDEAAEKAYVPGH